MSRWWNQVLDLIYPPFCAACVGPSSGVLCEVCDRAMEWVAGKTCERCGAELAGKTCGECRGRTYPFARAVALGKYEGNLRTLLLKFKLGGERTLARELGRRLAQRVLDEGVAVDAVVAVPMRRWAVLRRGYNPAEELATEMAQAFGRPYRKALLKTRGTRPQAALRLEERLQNPSGAFQVRKAKWVRSRAILIVDDVLTTGATVSECARVLLGAGTREVNVAVVGR